MSNFIQLEYVSRSTQGRNEPDKINTDMVIVNLDNVLVIHIPNHSIVLQEEHRFTLTDRSWEVLMKAIEG